MRKPILKTKNRRKNRSETLQVADTPALADTQAGARQEPEPATKPTRLDKDKTIELAKETLRQICLAQDAPANAKATAARTLLELVGALGRHADPASMNTLPASEMSLEQLEARIASLVTH
jgi:hypothetical protein